MNGKALGLIETFGLVPAVEAADVAVKSANVAIEGCRYVGAGLVTVMMTGDVSSVKASVEAGRSAAERLGEVRSVTVIARTGEGLETILVEGEEPSEPLPREEAPEDNEPEAVVCESTAEVIEEAEQVLEEPLTVSEEPPAEIAEEAAPGSEPEVKDIPEESESKVKTTFDRGVLKKMNVSKLRHLARQMEKISLNRKEIKFARKKELIEEIMKAYRQEEE